MFPLVKQLAASLGNLSGESSPSDFGRVELVTSPRRFFINGLEVSRHRRFRIVEFAEAIQLWVMSVTARRAVKDLLRKQRLTPDGNQPFRIEMFWMYRPEPH